MTNKYTYSVPFTEEQLYDDYVNKRMTQAEIGAKYGTTQHVVWRAMRKMGVPTRVAAKRDQQGPLNSTWKGGRRLVNYKTPEGYRYLSHGPDKGYWMVLMPSHPHAHKKTGYVMEHIVIALQAAGRERMNTDECVHHINFDRKDNRPENLQICTKDKHREYHGRLELLTRDLMARGIVRFDPEVGYVIAEGS